MNPFGSFKKLYIAFFIVSMSSSLLRYIFHLKNSRNPTLADIPVKTTRVALIDSNMLTFPGLACFITQLLIYVSSPATKSPKLQKSRFNEEQISETSLLTPKWIISYLVFYIFYSTHNNLLMNTVQYDPSGHLLCALSSYANWMNYYKVTQQMKSESPYIKHLCIVLRQIGVMLTFYQLYCLFWTCLIFHDHSEVLYGYINGMIVCLLSF